MEIMRTLCRVYLLMLSFYHVITGIISYFLPTFALRFYKAIYDCTPQNREEVMLNLRPWGALALFAGVVGFFPAGDPERYVGVVIGLWLLLTMRIGYRIVLRRRIMELGSVEPRRNIFSIGIICFGVLILTLWLVIGVW